MKLLLTILLFISVSATAQLQSFIVRDGVLISLNPSTGVEIPITKHRTLVTLPADVTNSTILMADAIGLSFNVVSGTTYRFYALIPYTAAAATTGSRWSITTPLSTFLNYTSRYTLTATSQTVNNLSVGDLPAAANATSLLLGNLAIIEGVVRPTVNGTVQVRFSSEVAASAITAKAGATIEYW